MRSICFKHVIHISLLLLLLPLAGRAAGYADPPSYVPVWNTLSSQEQEVFLSFNYRNFFDKVIIAYEDEGHYYLPVSEIFSSLKIAHEVNPSDLSVEGFFIQEGNRFQLDLSGGNLEVTLDSKERFTYPGTHMLVKELDYYIRLEVFAEVFDLNFTVDINSLSLQLQTPHTLPIVQEYQREQRRKRQDRYVGQLEYHPLRFDRDRAMLGGAFLDYSLTSNINEVQNSYVYNLDLGAELLGGDLQGSAFGSYSQNFSNFRTDNFRWRYVWRNSEYLTQAYAGQTISDGLINRNFTGFRLTNEPIEPRFIYDSYVIEGMAEPGSEVELYYNNVLYDFQRITEENRYRFLAPLTYGSSRLKLRIYGPDGRIREREERIQIPFNYLPEGEFTYHLNGGRLDNPIFGTAQNSYFTQGDMAYGISNWLTQKVGVEYFNEFRDQTPLVYSSTSARLFDQYLVNVDLAPGTFYRISNNVIYASSASWGIHYTYFRKAGIYNPVGNDYEFSADAYVPLNLGETPLNIRFNGRYAERNSNPNINYGLDLNTRIDRFNLRLSYRDRQFGEFALRSTASSQLSLSGTYLIARKPEIPRYLHNTFLRAGLDYNPGLQQLEEAEIQASRSIFDIGRLQATFSRNFIGEFNFFNIGLTLDLNPFRSTSTYRNTRNNTSFTQNIRGSIGYDDFNNNILLSNRQQVGRSAASVRLYVDSDNSGTYEPGEQVIDNKAVRISRASKSEMSDDGVLRFSQLQAYHQINMVINKANIQNPLLVPQLDEFSIVTDPNQYKPINIPFFVSGVIEGRVTRLTPGGRQALAGLRLYLTRDEGPFRKEMQTFSDGSFYAYEVPPGDYTLQADSTQLKFLDGRAQPDQIEFTVEARPEGDFVENLNFTILPRDTTNLIVEQKKDDAARDTSEVPQQTTDAPYHYLIQLASYASADWAKRADDRAEHHFPGQNFYIRYNPAADLYGLRTPPQHSKEHAIDRILRIMKSPFNEPAVVATKDTSDTARDLHPTYVIRLDSLKNERQAKIRVRTFEEVAGIEARVNASQNSAYYLVQSYPYDEKNKALSVLGRIRNLNLTEDPDLTYSIIERYDPAITELTFDYAIEIVGLTESQASEIFDQLSSEENLRPTGSRLERDGLSISIKGVNSWKRTIALKRELDKVLGVGTTVIIMTQYEAPRR